MEIFGFDAFSPAEIFAKVETVGVTKARLPVGPMLMLSVLAGAFIGIGALYYVLIRSDPTLGFAARQVLGGAAFSSGLLMVVVAGAELFTGNNLLIMARAARKISTLELLRSWLIVFCGNFVGAVGLACLVVLSNHPASNGGARPPVARTPPYQSSGAALRRTSSLSCLGTSSAAPFSSA